MNDYGFSIRLAVWGTPLTAIFTLIPAARARLGDDSQPSPADHAAALARSKANAFFAANYNILPPGKS